MLELAPAFAAARPQAACRLPEHAGSYEKEKEKYSTVGVFVCLTS